MPEVRDIRVPILLRVPLVKDGNTDDADFGHGFSRIRPLEGSPGFYCAFRSHSSAFATFPIALYATPKFFQIVLF